MAPPDKRGAFLMPTYFYLDFETRSEVDLRKVGALNYAKHESTEVISIAYGVDDDSIRHSTVAPDWTKFSSLTWVAHNCEFEEAILKEKYGFEPKAWLDTMALAASMSLPLSLEQLAKFFAMRKDMAGHGVMKKLSRPRRPSRGNKDKFWERETKPEDYEALDNYNIKDVEVMRECHKRMLSLTPMEQEVWILTRKVNALGSAVDVKSVAEMQKLLATETSALTAKLTELTGCSPRSSAKLAKWLKLPNVKKETVEKSLTSISLEDSRREVLNLRQVLSRSSLGKLKALEERTSKDGRLRSSLVYAGAQRTGRWSSRGVQLQNIPRGLGSLTSDAFDLLQQGRLTGALKLAPEMLRGFFLGPFLVGDYAQIEARILAWLAGDEEQLRQWSTGVDLYRRMAGRVYGKPPEQVTKDERFVGKTIILGCGYGMGGPKFRKTLDMHGVKVSEYFAARAVAAYRDEYPAIQRYWYFTQETFEKVQKFWRKQVVAKIPYKVCTLPSGREIFYAKPRYCNGELQVFNPNKLGGPGFDKTYGGKLVENIVQATARDVLADAMLRLDSAGFKLVLTVHDEIVAEEKASRLEEFKMLMKQTPSWAKGLPMDVEVFACDRYQK